MKGSYTGQSYGSSLTLNITKLCYMFSPIQLGRMIIAEILNTNKIPTLTQFIAKFDLEWQENTYD